MALMEFMRELHTQDYANSRARNAIDRTARYSLSMLMEMFIGRLIPLRGDVGYPIRSFGLNPCDIFILGYRKKMVSKHRYQFDELRRIGSEKKY